MKRISVLLCDDHAFLRIGLRSMITMEPDMTVVGEAANGRDAVKQARILKPDVVIMDIMMPELNGAESSKLILTERPETRIIVLTSFGTAPEINEALASGVVGVQLKESPTEGVIEAIRTVMRGERAIDPQLVLESREEDPASALTDKQRKILESVVRGLTNHDIAQQFGISEAGVKKHLRLIFSKLGSANRTEAVAIALRRQLLKT